MTPARLLTIMERHGISCAQLAARHELDHEVVWCWICGTQPIPPDRARRINIMARALDARAATQETP